MKRRVFSSSDARLASSSRRSTVEAVHTCSSTNAVSGGECPPVPDGREAHGPGDECDADCDRAGELQLRTDPTATHRSRHEEGGGKDEGDGADKENAYYKEAMAARNAPPAPAARAAWIQRAHGAYISAAALASTSEASTASLASTRGQTT